MGDMLVLSESNYDEITAKGVVVIDFYADWCGPCRVMAPTFEEASNEYKGKAVLAKVNVDENKGLSREFNILGIPTLLFYKDGAIVDRVSGVLDKNALYSKIDALL